MNIAIVGATGNVGRKIIEILEKKQINIENLFLLASKNSEGKKINYNGNEHIVTGLEKFDFSLRKGKFTKPSKPIPSVIFFKSIG